MKALKEIAYKRWLIIESFNTQAAKDFGKQAEVWRDLAPTTDSIAVEGLKLIFLVWIARTYESVAHRLTGG